MSTFISYISAYIAVGGVISCILLVANLVLSRRLKREAIQNVQELRQSISTFFEAYGRYPIVNGESDEQSSDVFNVLCGAQWITGHPVSDAVGRLNPELINFAVYYKGRRTLDKRGIDPWDEEYNIAIDTNGDGITEIRLLGRGEETIKRVEAPFAIWSNGPNRKNELGSGDDIASWIIP